MLSGSFARVATVTATTQRGAAPAGGIAGAMADVEVNFACTPLDPYSPGGGTKEAEVFQTKDLGEFVELLRTFCEGPRDILEGDTFITGGVTYHVRAVGQWYWSPMDSDYLAILLTQIK